MYVIRNIETGRYVAAPGSCNSYTRSLERAQTFQTLDAAQQNCCSENERPVAITSGASPSGLNSGLERGRPVPWGENRPHSKTGVTIMFSKRHYEFLAAFWRAQLDEINGRQATYRAINSMAVALARDNPRFDRNRFLAACCDTAADRVALLGRDAA